MQIFVQLTSCYLAEYINVYLGRLLMKPEMGFFRFTNVDIALYSEVTHID